MTSKADLLAKALKPAEEALRLHAHYKGKMQSMPKCAVRSLDDFALWYTPGVAAPCKAIQADPDRVFDYTNRGNTIAVVSDGTRVLGLGDIGPEAALPVMEGKALLFKYLGGVDAVPICLKTKDPNEVIRTVLLLAPSFGAINLEDIAMPKCFHVLRELQARCSIPVWHDDQQGTGTVLLAGLMNALQVVGKELGRVRIAMIGMGAANVPVYRFLTASGADPARIVACDLGGILGTHRREYECDPAFAEQWRVCLHSNPDRLKGHCRGPARGRHLRRLFRRRHHQAGVGQRNGARRRRLCLRKPGSGDLALGSQGSRGANRGDRTQRFPEPGQQFAGVSRHLSRGARRAGAHHHRRDGDGGCA